MFIVNSYMLAVIFCFITMLCWGSWGNTQKLAGKTWRYELFYWDYVVGMVLFAALLGFTMGSTGDEGRSFVRDLAQADWRNIGSVVAGGAIFNASNILLSASVSLAGMAVAFPLGVGLALVLGVFINWFGAPKGDPVVLFAGVALIVAAIVCNGLASARMSSGRQSGGSNRKGLMLAVAAGAVMSMFYRFVAAAMDLDHFENPTEGMLTPYSAIFVFSVGVLLSNFVFNTLAMRHPFVGDRVGYGEWFRGSAATHLVGMLGGAIWCLGTAFSYIAAGKAGAAISYALGQGAPMIAAIWGVFVWKEFRGADRRTGGLLALMFMLFAAGLSMIVAAGEKEPQTAARAELRAVPVIVETDMGNDIDDALALDLLYRAAREGKVEILGIGNHKLSATATDYIDILNTFYGFGSTPLAQGARLVANGEACDYTAAVTAMCDADGHPLYARTKSPEQIEESVAMYRRLLAASDDGSVTVISLGFATTLADLLSSGGDAISPLTGRELVARKAASLSIMAGSFPTATKPARAEFNIVNDIDAAVLLFDQWPTPIVCAPFELGRQVQFPGRIMAEGLDWAEHHPVVDGYRAYRPMPYDRAAWDLMSVLWVTAGEDLFTVSEPGRLSVDSEGYMHFEPCEGGTHRFLTATDAQAEALGRLIVETFTEELPADK